MRSCRSAGIFSSMSFRMSLPMTTVAAAPHRISRVVRPHSSASHEPADTTPKLIANSGNTS